MKYDEEGKKNLIAAMEAALETELRLTSDPPICHVTVHPLTAEERAQRFAPRVTVSFWSDVEGSA